MLYSLGATTGIHWFSYSKGNEEEKLGKLRRLKWMGALKHLFCVLIGSSVKWVHDSTSLAGMSGLFAVYTLILKAWKWTTEMVEWSPYLLLGLFLEFGGALQSFSLTLFWPLGTLSGPTAVCGYFYYRIELNCSSIEPDGVLGMAVELVLGSKTHLDDLH